VFLLSIKYILQISTAFFSTFGSLPLFQLTAAYCAPSECFHGPRFLSSHLRHTEMGKLHILEGYWWDYDTSQWVWTLMDDKALAALASLALFITFAGSRLWVLERFILCKFLGPGEIYLGGGEAADSWTPLSKLSQGQAALALPFFRKIRGAGGIPLRRRIPASFAGAAILNFAIFTAISVVIPWTMSGGSLETPIVRSLRTETCQAPSFNLDLLSKTHYDSDIGTMYYPNTALAVGYFKQCWLSGDGRRPKQTLACNKVFKDRLFPKVSDADCPFDSRICQNDTIPALPVKLVWGEQDPLTLASMGFNADAPFRIQHRLTCAPLRLDLLTWRRPTYDPFYTHILNFSSSSKASGEPTYGLHVELNTANEKFSGRATAKNPRVFSTIPDRLLRPVEDFDR
jgi:hypothetical protein